MEIISLVENFNSVKAVGKNDVIWSFSFRADNFLPRTEFPKLFSVTVSKGDLKRFVKFTGKHLCHLPQTCLKQDNFQVIEIRQHKGKTQICGKI